MADSNSESPLPRVRPVEILPVEQDGKRYLVLQDPLHYAPDSIVISPTAAMLLAYFDGTHTAGSLRAEIEKTYGQTIPSEQLRSFVEQLDRAGFLESDFFRNRRETIDRAFREAAIRPYQHGGQVYPLQADALRAQFDGYFSQVGPAHENGPIRAMIAPHIDIRFSGPEYALAYSRIALVPRPRRFVVFGTAHQSPSNLFVVTRKAYDTPLGPVETDGEFIDHLEQALGPRIFEDEWAHRTEHSIEFQVLFLKYLFPDDEDLKIVPVLCSSLHPWILQGGLPGDDPGVKAFVDAVCEGEEKLGPRVHIAAADLAHMGPKFGDAQPVDPAGLKRLEAEDRATLAHVEKVDPDGFFRDIQQEKDRRRICGLSPIYAMLQTLARETDGGAEKLRGELLRYGQAPDAATSSVVSFASVAIREEKE